MPKKIFLIRHGETDHNVQGFVQGWFDVPLSEEGIDQAKKLAHRLKKETIDVLYAFDLMRALHTAEEIAKARNEPQEGVLGLKVLTLSKIL